MDSSNELIFNLNLLKFTTMKKIFIITFLTIFTFSCESPAPAEMEAERAPGFLRTPDGDVAADDANPENLDLWDKYIEAHNNRDLDAIASMNIDSTQQMGSFKIIGPDGSLIDGTDTHIEFLKGWFEAENPTWNTFFSYTMKVENQPGEWVISGSQVKKTVDGEEVTSYDIIDAYIEEGKIGAFWVYTRAEGSQE